MFKGLGNAGGILQIIGLLVSIYSAIAAVFALVVGTTMTALLSLAAGVIAGILLFGFGGAFRAMTVLVENSQRSADALEALAHRRQREAEPKR